MLTEYNHLPWHANAEVPCIYHLYRTKLNAKKKLKQNRGLANKAIKFLKQLFFFFFWRFAPANRYIKSIEKQLFLFNGLHPQTVTSRKVWRNRHFPCTVCARKPLHTSNNFIQRDRYLIRFARLEIWVNIIIGVSKKKQKSHSCTDTEGICKISRGELGKWCRKISKIQ